MTTETWAVENKRMTPNNALQQTFDPAARLAAAKLTAASNAAELWR